MPASQDHIDADTPLGAHLVDGGATFRLWAPGADAVHVAFGRDADPARADWRPSDDTLLVRDDGGRWGGLFPGVEDGTPYRFWTSGPGGSGFKRDPRAVELEERFPDPACIVRAPSRYPWHDADFRPPPFQQLVLYQLHVGVYYASRDGVDIRPHRVAKFLDVLDRLEYLSELGVNAIQPLPLVEWQGLHSRGYNNTDFFSPEMDYAVPPAELPPYLERINARLRAKGKEPLRAEHLRTHGDQLRAMVDLFHVYGIAVIADVVYNHAGGPFDAQSLRFIDQSASRDWWDADAYFLAGDGWAGGRIFDYAKAEVRQFIIDNARFFIDQYHVDGFRYDEVRVIRNNGGAQFLRDLTATLRYHKPAAFHLAEWWDWDRATPVLPAEQGGLGFDAAMDDRLRGAVRAALGAVAADPPGTPDLDAVGRAMERAAAYPAMWRSSTHLENHDLVDADRGNPADIQPRIAALASPADSRDWHARSRTRVATGLLLTAPGIPMLFMGEEFLEDKPWHNDSDHEEFLIDWAGAESPGPMRDFLAFTRDLVRLRRRLPALTGEQLRVFHVHDANRVIAFHRWMEGSGDDVVVVASLAESTSYGYEIGFPWPGRWTEAFNSDFYDGLPNPQVAGNGGGVWVDGGALHGFAHSAALTLPASSILVLTRD